MDQRVLAVVDDMIFAAKIKGTGAAIGTPVEFVRSVSAAVAAIEREKPSLIICDLHAEKCDPYQLAREIKKHAVGQSVTMLGFFSHVNIELKHRAEEAGFDRVLPRSAFVKNLVEILRGE
jgi:CheY-like chemotaxis protein